MERSCLCVDFAVRDPHLSGHFMRISLSSHFALITAVGEVAQAVKPRSEEASRRFEFRLPTRFWSFLPPFAYPYSSWTLCGRFGQPNWIVWKANFPLTYLTDKVIQRDDYTDTLNYIATQTKNNLGPDVRQVAYCEAQSLSAKFMSERQKAKEKGEPMEKDMQMMRGIRCHEVASRNWTDWLYFQRKPKGDNEFLNR